MSAAEFATMLEIQKSMASHLFNMLSRKNYGKKRVTISKIRHPFESCPTHQPKDK